MSSLLFIIKIIFKDNFVEPFCVFEINFQKICLINYINSHSINFFLKFMLLFILIIIYKFYLLAKLIYNFLLCTNDRNNL